MANRNPYKDMKLPEHLGGESSEIMSKVKRPAWKDAIDKLLNAERDADVNKQIDDAVVFDEHTLYGKHMEPKLKSKDFGVDLAPKPTKLPIEKPKYQYDAPIGPEDEPVVSYEEPAETPIDYANDEEYTTVEGSAPSPRKDVEGAVMAKESSVLKDVLDALKPSSEMLKKMKNVQAMRRADRASSADRWQKASNFKRALEQISNPWAGR
jgi:hypothetical protein